MAKLDTPQITPQAARPDDPGPHPKSHPIDGHGHEFGKADWGALWDRCLRPGSCRGPADGSEVDGRRDLPQRLLGAPGGIPRRNHRSRPPPRRGTSVRRASSPRKARPPAGTPLLVPAIHGGSRSTPNPGSRTGRGVRSPRTPAERKGLP
jgi:hypothetical protein